MLHLLNRLFFFPMAAYQWITRKHPARRWWHRVDEHVLIGAMPFSADAEFLYQQGVRATVNLCEEYAGPTVRYSALGIEQLYLPTLDFTTPSLGDIERALDFIEAQKQQGHQVYVHCKAGRGRSATVLLCYLLQHHEAMSPQEAQAHLQAIRPRIVPLLWKRKGVQEYAQKRAQANAQTHPG